jgi:hypothetical protein
MFNSSQAPIVALVLYVGACLIINSLRLRSKLKRQGIVPAGLSAWQYLYDNGDDESFLNITGFDRASFHLLHDCVFPPAVIGAKRGRRSNLDNKGKLAVVLLFATSKMAIKQLCLILALLPPISL